MEEKNRETTHGASPAIISGGRGKTGVLLLNMGGPDSLAAVRPFLYNLFSDREIIRLGPPFMQKPLAWLISTTRAKKSSEMYRLIGGKSPIGPITESQAKALKERLQRHKSSHTEFRIYVGMRYWHPFIEQTVEEMHRDGIRRMIALSLYPQFSSTTSGSSFTALKAVVSRLGIATEYVRSWHDHPLYIQALADTIRKGMDSFPKEKDRKEIPVLFSAHSLPQEVIDNGDPYVEQTVGTIREIAKRIPINWHLSYQSRSGPVKWLEPPTEQKLQALAQNGVKDLLIVPISFVSDHIETLYEIDILYKGLASKLGLNIKRAESLNTHPTFISALEDIVLNASHKFNAEV